MKELLYFIVKNGVSLFLASMYHRQFSLFTEIVALQIHWHDLVQYDEKLNNMPLLCIRIWGLKLCRRIHKLLIF